MLVTAALLPLALGISGDIYVAVARIANQTAIGAAAAVTGIIVLAVGARESSQPRKVAVMPTMSAQGGGGSLAVRW